MAEEKGRAERMLERVRDQKILHRQRGTVYRVLFGTGGALLILVGLLLSAPGVPGPGLLLIALGLGMLALEFDRAERLLERVLGRLDRLGAQATRAKPWQKAVAALAVGVAAACAIGAVLLWDVPFFPG